MLRWTVCLALVAVTFATTTSVEAQRRAPLRNLFRNLGQGWGAGNHWQNPGHDSGYYSPQSDEYSYGNNDWQYQGQHQTSDNGQIIQAPGDGQIIYQDATPNQSDSSDSPETPPQPPQPDVDDNSASRLLNQQRPYSQIRQTSQPIRNQQFQNQRIQQPPIINQSIQGQQPYRGTSSSIGDQTQINRYLKPYHSNTSTGSSSINGGGQFQIAPGKIPGTSTGWTSQGSSTRGQSSGQKYLPGK